MSWLDKLGKKALDAIDSAARAGEQVKERALPLLEHTPLAARVRDRGKKLDISDVPSPERNTSPFAPPPSADDPKAPLAKPELAAQIFGRATDPWTGRALQLLVDRDIEHEFVDLEAEGGAQLEARLVGETNNPGAPFIFLRGEHIGGFNALSEIDRLGQLDELVTPVNERGPANGRRRIVVQRRSGDDLAPGERGNPDDRQ